MRYSGLRLRQNLLFRIGEVNAVSEDDIRSTEANVMEIGHIVHARELSNMSDLIQVLRCMGMKQAASLSGFLNGGLQQVFGTAGYETRSVGIM